VGVTFINQPNTTAGGFTRGSVIFIGAFTSSGWNLHVIAPAAAMLLNCLDAFVEMPLQMLGRPILYKQTGFKFFRPSALPLANMLADIPFSFSRILIFNIIVRTHFTRRSI
jgi:ATP-binding cassette subfamily G (WHITE) protein 2 (SNQ2)